MDGVPIGEALARDDARFAAEWWHWFFLGQEAKPAERVISADPDAWYQIDPEQMGARRGQLRGQNRQPRDQRANCGGIPAAIARAGGAAR
jgi:haloacetate dehalogenase